MRAPRESLPARLAASLSDGRLVGRDRELARIRTVLGRAGPAWPACVVLTGEAGMGKTRLAAEVAARHAGTVLLGSCREDPDRPYQPFAECLDQVTPGAGAFAGGRAAGERPGERYLIFDRVRAALVHAGASAPLLVVLEDLHWADRATLALLQHVLTAPGEARVAFLLTCRDEAGDGQELAATLAEVERSHAFVRVVLPGLDAEAVGRLAEERGTPVAGQDAAEALRRGTGGNPFYVREVLRAPPGEPAPRSVRAILHRRLADLGEEVVALLTLAAAAGADLDEELVAAASGYTPEEVLALLEAAEHAGMVAPAPAGGRLVFVHAIVQRALYDELPGVRRGALHRRLAEAHDRLRPARPGLDVLDWARHWSAALPSDPARVGPATVAAGDLTLARRDPQAAERWYRLALAAAERAGDEALRTDALLGLGGALVGMGDPGSREVLLEASRLALRRGDRDALVRAALRNHRGMASVVGEVDDERVAVLEAALEAAGPGDSANRALLLTALATEVYFAADNRPSSLELGDEAVAVARRVGDPYTLATVLAPRQSPWTPDGLDLQDEAAREAVALADRVGDPLLQHRALRWRSAALLAQGRIEEARRAIARQDEVARRSGDPAARALAAYDRSSLALVAGRLNDAETLAGEALDLGMKAGQPDAHAFHLNALSAIRFDQGRLGELADLAAAAVQGRRADDPWRALAALCLAEADRHDEARDLLTGVELAAQRVDVTWLSANVAFAHVAADVGAAEPAAWLLDELRPWRGRIAWNSALWGSVDLALGRLAALLDRHHEAVAHLRAARRLAESWRAPVWLARADRALAEVARAPSGRLEGRPERPPVVVGGRLARSGVVWTVELRGRRCTVPDAKGMRYLAILLAEPGVERHSSELQASVSGVPEHNGHAGPVLDAQARTAYRLRLEDLDEELETARGFGDPVRLERAQAEREAIGRELAAALGLNGRERRLGDGQERARINVTRALKRAVARIAETEPAVGHHLRAAVRTGVFCVYDPSPADLAVWDVSP